MSKFTLPQQEINTFCQRIFNHPSYSITLLQSDTCICILDNQDTIWISTLGNSLTNVSKIHSIPFRNSPRTLSDHIPLSIYSSRSDIKAIIQTHSTALESFAVSSTVPETRIHPQIYHICGIPILTSKEIITTEALDSLLFEIFKSPDVHCAIVSGVGVLCVGPTLLDAYVALETLDFCARLILRCRRIGVPRILTNDQLQMLQPFKFPIQSIQSPTRQISHIEKQIRLEIIEALKKCIQLGLMSSFSGTISMKLNSTQIVITPTSVDRLQITVDDLILVSVDPFFKDQFTIMIDSLEKTLYPSRDLKIHFEIYSRIQNVGFIISAHPLNIASLCSIGWGLNGNVVSGPYSKISKVLSIPIDGDSEYIAESFMKLKNEGILVPSILISNEGSITIGENSIDVIERLQELESMCAIAIDACSLGNVDQDIFRL